MQNKFILGCDPEIFLTDAAGAMVSAIGKIGGSKQNPRPLPIGNGYAVQEDNVAIEFNTPPASTKEEFNNCINNAINYLRGMVGDIGLQFSELSAVAFPMEELNNPEALIFGCDPDFNAWKDGARNPRPKAADWKLRSCGGHVHIGYQFEDANALHSFIRHLDLYLGVPSTILDTGDARRELYGKAGAFRYKPYGGEYRSLSNFWVFTPTLRNWVWESVELAMDAWQNKKIDIDAERKHILNAINRNDKDMAFKLVQKHNLLLV